MTPLLRTTLSQTISNVINDAKRYPVWINSPGFWVTLSYRIRFLRKYGSFRYRFLLPVDILFGIVRRFVSTTIIPSSTSIGSGLCMPHCDGIIINAKSVIGSNITIFQQVTLGEWHGLAPKIFDNTALYAGAKIIGGAVVGKNCKIGANVVITSDVPDNSSVSTEKAILRKRS